MALRRLALTVSNKPTYKGLKHGLLPHGVHTESRNKPTYKGLKPGDDVDVVGVEVE